MADLHLRVSEAERERYLKRGGASIAVILVHLVILLALMTAGRFGILVHQMPKETILLLPPLQKEKRSAPAFPVVPVPTERPVQQPETSISGIDQTIKTLDTSDPCLAAGNTHSECIHKNIFGR